MGNRPQRKNDAADSGGEPMTFQSLAELRLYVAKQAVEAHEWQTYDLQRATEVLEARRERSRQLRQKRQAAYRERKRQADGFD